MDAAASPVACCCRCCLAAACRLLLLGPAAGSSPPAGTAAALRALCLAAGCAAAAPCCPLVFVMAARARRHSAPPPLPASAEGSQAGRGLRFVWGRPAVHAGAKICTGWQQVLWQQAARTASHLCRPCPPAPPGAAGFRRLLRQQLRPASQSRRQASVMQCSRAHRGSGSTTCQRVPASQPASDPSHLVFCLLVRSWL